MNLFRVLRGSLRGIGFLGFLGFFVTLLPAQSPSAALAVTDIGSRRELFVDDVLIDQLKGGAKLRLHHPVPREVVIVLDAPWEGTGSGGYHCFFQDGDRYRMYYKGWNIAMDPEKKRIKPSRSTVCYAESHDGIHWRKPNLGLVEYNGSKENNIIMADGPLGQMQITAAYMAVTKDDNPAAAPDARYKAMGLSIKPKGMVPFKSADGINWVPMADAPVITSGAFDTQNLGFWDPVRGEYRAYWRNFAHGDNNTATANPIGVRAIRTATSKDYIHWDTPKDLVYVDSPEEALNTSVIKPYHRAPHLLIGFPARYIDRDWSDSTRALPERAERESRGAIHRRYGTALTESLIMASRDGVNFKRWNEGFLRPGTERPGTWSYGQQFIGWHLVETKSALEGAPDELSFYASESYWTGNSSEVRRFTLRLDGFVSVEAPATGGELITKPVRFQGSRLFLNFSTSAAGSVRVELHDAAGRPLPNFALADCPPVFGDAIEREVKWKEGSDLAALAGQVVRLRFVIHDADLFAYQFKN